MKLLSVLIDIVPRLRLSTFGFPRLSVRDPVGLQRGKSFDRKFYTWPNPGDVAIELLYRSRQSIRKINSDQSQTHTPTQA